jgi:hypothetical protein
MFTERSPGARQLDIAGANSVGFLPPRAGPLTVTLTWEQTDGSNPSCTGSFTTTLQIAAARPVSPRLPRPDGRALRNTTEFQWLIGFGRNFDRSPIEIRFRAVRGAALPGARVPFKSAKFILRPTDPATAGGTRRRALNGVTATLRAELQELGGGDAVDGLGLTFRVLHRATNPRLGYEIQVLQARKRIARLRAASRCDSFFCPFSILRFDR